MGRPERLGGRASAVLSGSRAVTFVAVVAVAASLAACDRESDEPSTEPSAASLRRSSESTLARLKADNTRAVRRQRRAARAGAPAPARSAPKGSQRIELPGGVVVTTPPAPRVTATHPESGCTVLEGPGHRRLGIPPAPGIRARRVGPEKFEVRYRFAAVAPRCRPSSLSVKVDVNDDPLPGAGTVASVNGLRGRIVFSVPEQLADADVARATASGHDGVPSRSTSVLIR
jgi:hypothetical protein